uniref:ATP-dependent DNA helicase n=1 Tax=Salix viminalis TaxID=40686 RepID=A0A6N2NFY9_SALVM
MLIKYLFKYVSKGLDMYRVVLQYDTNDEIQAYLNCRFIYPYEDVSGKQCLLNGLNTTNNSLDARELYYSEFPNKYVWDSRYKEWIVRSKELSLGRSTEFVDLRKVCGIVYPAFQLTCKAHMLLGDDIEWYEAFCEAVATASLLQIRQLFVSCRPFDFIIPNLILSDDQLKNYMLYELEQLFNAFATTLQDHSFQHSLNFASLNHGQRVVVFVHGHGGTSKTFLWNIIINRVRSESLIVLVVTSFGIACVLLPNGRTTHSRFKIPLSIDESSTSAIKKNTHLSNLVKKNPLL